MARNASRECDGVSDCRPLVRRGGAVVVQKPALWAESARGRLRLWAGWAYSR